MIEAIDEIFDMIGNCSYKYSRMYCLMFSGVANFLLGYGLMILVIETIYAIDGVVILDLNDSNWVGFIFLPIFITGMKDVF